MGKIADNTGIGQHLAVHARKFAEPILKRFRLRSKRQIEFHFE